MSELAVHLLPIDRQIRNHALLCTIGFLILLPIGALVGRYLRTFSNKWFWAHSIIQFLVAGPVILAGWALGYKSTAVLFTGGHFVDPHKKIGLTLLILYLIQIFLGMIIHAFRTPRLLGGHRPPQNYFHAILGLAILALAAYQVHYGLTIEWQQSTLSGAVVPQSAIHAWIALIVIFWVLYAAGLALLPRQYNQEAANRNSKGMVGKA